MPSTAFRAVQAAALAVCMSSIASPSTAEDLVAFTDKITSAASPSHVFILHNKGAWTSIYADTIIARLKSLNYPYGLQGYNEGDRPKDIARNIPWTTYGVVICLAEVRECDYIKAEAEKKGFEGEFYNYLLEER